MHGRPSEDPPILSPMGLPANNAPLALLKVTAALCIFASVAGPSCVQCPFPHGRQPRLMAEALPLIAYIESKGLGCARHLCFSTRMIHRPPRSAIPLPAHASPSAPHMQL